MKMSHNILGCSAIAATALAISASTTQAQNILVNGDFENAGGFTANPITTTSGSGGTTGVGAGWATFGGSQSDMSSSPDFPQSGSFSLLAVNNPGNNWNPQGAYQIVGGIAAGQIYTLSSYFLQDTAFSGTYGTPVALQIGFGNLVGGTWTAVGGSTTWGFGPAPAGSVPSLNTWNQGSVTAMAPAGASEAEVYLFFMDNGQTSADTLYFDNAQLVPTPEPTTLALAGLGGAFALSLIRRRKG
jgi:PEP-CTERM motif